VDKLLHGVDLIMQKERVVSRRMPFDHKRSILLETFHIQVKYKHFLRWWSFTSFMCI